MAVDGKSPDADIARMFRMDQAGAELEDMRVVAVKIAEIVAAYYVALLTGGVPAEIAAQLTGMYQQMTLMKVMA